MISKHSSKKRLVDNFFSLTVIQIAGYIIPLISVPFLLRTIGTEKYGLFSLAGAFATYVQVFLDYGFNITGIRDISKNRNSLKKLSFIVSSIISAKILLFVFSLSVAIPIIWIVPRFHNDFWVYFVVIFSYIGTSILPSWYFQGIEKMKILAILNLASKIVYLVFIILIIRTSDDFKWLLLISIFSTYSFTCVGMAIMIKQVKISIRVSSGWRTIKKGFGIFTTQFWATILQVSTVFILGLFADNKTVGTYAVAEKIVKAVISMGIPFCSSIFPRSSLLFKSSPEKALLFLRKFMVIGGSTMLLASIILFCTASTTIKLIMGYTSTDAELLIRILSILPLSIFIDNVYGTQILLNIKHEYDVIRTVMISSIIAVILLISLIPVWGPVGAAFSYLISELVILVLMCVALWKAGITPSLSLRVNSKFTQRI